MVKSQVHLPARTTTPVVPSPISSSWLCANCTSSFPIWCSTSIILRMVAPSLVTVTSPSELTMSLSRPRGPREVRRMVAICLAADICDWKSFFYQKFAACLCCLQWWTFHWWCCLPRQISLCMLAYCTSALLHKYMHKHRCTLLFNFLPSINWLK